MNIDDYILEHIDPEPDYLHRLWRATHLHLNYPRMASGHLQGRLLRMLVHMIRPQQVLEIGTFTGYSALCMASALEPEAMLHTIEINDETIIKILKVASDVYGTEIWKCSTASEEAAALADNLMDALEGVGVQRARGVKEGSQSGSGDYYVLNHTKMPSALLEMGFMQNKKDNKYFDKNVDEYAEALTQAVLDTWEEFHVDLDDVASMDKS
jgi:hypothetical protein